MLFFNALDSATYVGAGCFVSRLDDSSRSMYVNEKHDGSPRSGNDTSR